MSTYRCPLCGASHKDDAERCRLCGQSLKADTVAVAPPRATTGPVRAQRGIKGVVLIGLGLVIALGAVAVAFGLVQENKQVRQAKELVTGPVDGWSTQEDHEGRFRVDLPGTRTRSLMPVAGADDGTVTAWAASVGDDTDLVAGWGTVTPPLTDGVISAPIATQYLKDTVLPRWAAANGLAMSDLQLTESGIGGLPAVTARTIQADLTLRGREAYGDVAVILDGTRLFVLQATSVYKDAPQLDRMARSFSLTALS